VAGFFIEKTAVFGGGEKVKIYIEKFIQILQLML
jgi:hypothetical protein